MLLENARSSFNNALSIMLVLTTIAVIVIFVLYLHKMRQGDDKNMPYILFALGTLSSICALGGIALTLAT